MPISIRDVCSVQDRAWVQAQYPVYLDALSPGSALAAHGEYAERQVELTARWFSDRTTQPLLLLKDDTPVGFALVCRVAQAGWPAVDFRLADFFIAPPWRRRGIGRLAAQLIFNRFAGRWEIGEFLSNPPAVAFWRTIVSQYTGGKFREIVAEGEVRQLFESARPRAVEG